MTTLMSHWINGSKVESHTDTHHNVFNPATGQTTARVSFADAALCDKTINAAKAAFPAWSDKPAHKRAQILLEFRGLLKKYQTDLATLVTREHGKTIDDAKGSVARAIEVVEHHVGIAKQLAEPFSHEVASHIDCHTFRQALGVCMGVSPFNFPVMVPVWMMVPAIACGNTFILKPSEQAPSAPLFLMELLHEAGLPEGVANCLQGNKDTVEYLLEHPDIKAATAVASTPVAEAIYHKASLHGKRCHTFGGAKNHAVVMPDADIDYAAKAITGAAFGSAGERCMALSVVVTTNDETADALVSALVPMLNAIRIGPGDAKDIDMGPLINAAHRERVLHAVSQGAEEGASLLVDGRDYQNSQYPNGFYMGPCLFDKVSPDMSVYQNEIFGPVLCIVRTHSFDEALAIVNAHQYGNGSAIFTKDGYSAREYARRVQAGMVGVNIPIPVPVAWHPFGGWKRSAFGDTNMHANESVNFYTRRKTVTCRWLENAPPVSTFSMPTHD